MIKYIIRNKKTGKFLRRIKRGRIYNKWVCSADDATLINTCSAASMIAQRFDTQLPPNQRYTSKRARMFPDRYTVEVINVSILMYPIGLQPFIDGALNGNIN